MALSPQYAGSGGGLLPASSQSQAVLPVGYQKIDEVPGQGLTKAQIAATQALVSADGNQPSATLASTTGTPGQIVKLSDGPDKGVTLVWAIPEGRTTYAWCWQIYPLAAY